MEEKKGGFWKKIGAIFMSAFLALSGGEIVVAQTPRLDSGRPHVESENLVEEWANFNMIMDRYPQFRESGERIISLRDIKETPVGGEVCDTMVPQGLETLDDYLLVTAYDGIEGYKRELELHSYRKDMREKAAAEQNHHAHNSVIIVLDKNTNRILTTLELEDKNHVGGIAIDDKNAYIAKSSDGEISVISLDNLRQAIKENVDGGIESSKISYDENLRCDCDASFVTTRETNDGRTQLAVGTWKPFPGVSTIRIFDFNDEGLLELNQTFATNSSANGAKFVRRGDEEYFIVACSLGRSLNSNLFVYNVEELDGDIILSQKSHMSLPPMTEELAVIENEDGSRSLLVGSEAFSTRYEIGKRDIVSNGIMVMDLDTILDMEKEPRKVGELINTDIYMEEQIEKEDPEDERDDDDIER